jgi:hypothetical protein
MKTYSGQAIFIAYGLVFSIPGICAVKMAKDAAVPILMIAIQPFKWMVKVICVVPWRLESMETGEISCGLR